MYSGKVYREHEKNDPGSIDPKKTPTPSCCLGGIEMERTVSLADVVRIGGPEILRFCQIKGASGFGELRNYIYLSYVMLLTTSLHNFKK